MSVQKIYVHENISDLPPSIIKLTTTTDNRLILWQEYSFVYVCKNQQKFCHTTRTISLPFCEWVVEGAYFKITAYRYKNVYSGIMFNLQVCRSRKFSKFFNVGWFISITNHNM